MKSHAITNGIITFDDTNMFATALTLSSTANSQPRTVPNNNDIATGMAALAFVANIGGTAHSYIFEQVDAKQNTANDILVDLVRVVPSRTSVRHI